jgi:hypothetical protein
MRQDRQHKISKPLPLTKKEASFGFSIIEVIIGIVILGIIGMAIWSFQRDIFSLNSIISGDIVVEEEMRLIFKTITAEIRSASPSSLGAYPIAEATSTSFTFYCDIDDDGLKERIRYFLDGEILKKGVLKPSGNPLSYNQTDEKISQVVHNVANDSTPIFSYYDANYDGFTPPLTEPVNILSVRLVKITVIINRNSSGFLTFTTQASMRNLKDNL